MKHHRLLAFFLITFGNLMGHGSFNCFIQIDCGLTVHIYN